MPVGKGKTVADGYVELRLDDSKLDADTRSKVAKVTNVFGSRLNKELQNLDIDPIDLQANPRDALRSVDQVQDKLRAMSRDAATVEVKVRTESALRELAQFRRKLGDIGPEAGPDAASGFVAKFSQRLGPLVGSIPLTGPMTTALAGAGVAAAPLLGSIIAGAVIGGAGIGGVVGGLAIAAKDERVKGAAKTLADEFSERLEDAGGAFVTPALEGVRTIDAALDSVDLTRIFKDAAQYVDPLAQGVASLVTDLSDALEDLVANAGPVVQVIGDGIAEIGKSLGDGLSSLSDNGDEAATSLSILFAAIDSGISTTLTVVNALTELYGIGQKIGADTGLQLVLKLTRTELDKTDESAKNASAGVDGLGQSTKITASKTDQLAAAQKELKPVQDALAASQKALSSTLDQIGSKAGSAGLTATSLRTAYQNLYGATISQTEANEAFQESFDGLSETVKANAKEFKNNRDNLDLHTRAGRSNRDALQGLLQSNNELYFADIAAGKSVEYATSKHKARTEQVVKEAEKVHLNKGETDKLINTYGKIPGKKITDLVLAGVNSVVDELKKLYTLQRALALGINVNLVTGTGTVKNFKAAGGAIHGPGTGTSDDVPVMASHGEHMWTAAEVRAAGGHSVMHAMRKAALRSYATGGPILTSVDESRRWPFLTNLGNTKVMSRDEAAAKVAPVFGGPWPSSPSAVRGDSGRWRKIRLFLENAHMGGSFGNGYRPGDPKWHGSGWAVDWMGFNQDALASKLAALHPLELIHRTNKRDYAYTRGRNKGSFNETLMNQHRNHIHIAMRRGGEVPKLIPFGSYDNGGFLPPGLSLAYNGTGRPEPTGHGLGEVHIHIHDSVIASKRQAVDLVAEAYRQAVYERKIK